MEDFKGEIWRAIIYKGIDYTGMYYISNFGRVKSTRFNRVKILKTSSSGNKYMKYKCVNLCIKGNPIHVYVSVLVCNAFIRRKTKGEVIDHKDGNCLNNHADNLQLITQRAKLSKERTKKSGLPIGVFMNQGKTFSSQIGFKGSLDKISLGSYQSLHEAAVAYKIALRLIEKENSKGLILEAVSAYRTSLGYRKLLGHIRLLKTKNDTIKLYK